MTTAAEEQAGAALKASAAINAGQQAITDESRVLLAGLLRDEMRVAVAEGVAAAAPAILAAVSEEAMERFWAKGFEVAQKQAKKRLRDGAGDLVLSGLRGLLKWGSMVVILLAFAYWVGGWALAKVIWTAITKG